MRSQVLAALTAHQETFERLRNEGIDAIMAVGTLLGETLHRGDKILVAGNGGSASDAQHMVAELVGRYLKERGALPAIALTTDTSILTAVGNDYGFDQVFSRQVEGLGRQGDVLLAISTSGNSANLIRAVESARAQKMVTVGLLGKDGGRLKEMVDHPIVVPSQETPRIQEAHLWIYHTWCEMIDEQAG